jgi:hypothetical protein
MLDAYIIDRIRREREQARQRDGRIPLHIEPPRAPTEDGPSAPPLDKEKPERGAVIIDFSL